MKAKKSPQAQKVATSAKKSPQAQRKMAPSSGFPQFVKSISSYLLAKHGHAQGGAEGVRSSALGR